MTYCDDCELDYNKSELTDIGDPFGLGERHFICEPCGDKRYDLDLERLYE